MFELNKIILKEWIKYFDYTASWLAYKPIEDKLQEILLTYANTHSEVWYNSKMTNDYYEEARVSLKKTLEVNDDFYIIPCWTWATWAIKKFQELMWIYISPFTKRRLDIKKDDLANLPLVIICPFEHHSNELSYREWLCELVRIPLNHEWTIDLEVLEKVLKNNKTREIIWSFSIASNVTGIINPIEKISLLFKKYNWILALDGAASSAYMNVDSSLYDAMFLSPHKLIGGPWSCWLLVIKKDICNDFDKPTFSWGGTVEYVSRSTHNYIDNFELREDVWTPWILQFIKASLAYELRNEFWLKNILEKEKELKRYFWKKILEIENIELYCSKNHDKLAIFSFNIKWISPYDIAKKLSDEYWIQTRAWCSCAWPYWHDLLNFKDEQEFSFKPGWLRVWFHYINTIEDIDYFINSLKSVILKLK